MSRRRETILRCARELFLEKGFAATTIAEIRAASGATTGSIYHAFGSKEGIALALVRDAIAAWTLVTRSLQRSEDAEDLIRATVEGLLTWAGDDPVGFQVLDQLRSQGESGAAGSELFQMLEVGRATSRVVLKDFVADGTIRAIDACLAQALILGPSFEYLRSLSHSENLTPTKAALAELSDAAWCSIAPTD
jgi:AcrR family transcriptional regulator